MSALASRFGAAAGVGAGALKSRSNKPPPTPLGDAAAAGAAGAGAAAAGRAEEAEAEVDEEREGGPARRSIEVVGAALRVGAGTAEDDVRVGRVEEGGAGADSGEGAAALLSSSVSGSGGGPSIAQRRDSYLERMNDSILLQCMQNQLLLGERLVREHTARAGRDLALDAPPSKRWRVDFPSVGCSAGQLHQS